MSICKKYGWTIEYTESISSDWEEFIMDEWEEESKQSKTNQ